DELLAVNLRAPMALTHALLPRLAATHGAVAFVSSVHAALPAPEFAVYTASKAALDGFARSLRIELAGQVDVLTLWAGATRTGMHAKAGVPAGRLPVERFPSAEATAAGIARTIDRRRSGSIGAGNGLLHWAGVHLEAPIDGAMRARARRAGSATPPSSGRQAVITGAAEGIGRALAEAFGAQGYAVTGVDVNAALAAQTEAELAGRGVQIRFVQADLSRPAELARLAADLSAGPAIDLLIPYAGIICVGPFAASDLAAQQRVLDVNLAAPLQLTTALLAADKLAPGGSLVFVSSLSRLLSYPGAAVYAASKDGLASYARSVAVALAPQGIHVLAVYPGPTRTAHARRYSPDNSREARRMAPDVVAAAGARAVARRRRVLIPGLGNQAFAVVGRWLPWLGEEAMKRTVWGKLEQSASDRL
ncbi:MAG TPA: SDR family NAD(P)-dependent oxidoreductase, partial [Rubrivivax sp.]|nr:SDR family NAD(P)-dependent oxidoreductase [Rubrivivax sp.]